MSPILLKSYRIEYETTSITLPEIIRKYSLKQSQTSKWKKQPQSVPPMIIKPRPLEILTTPENTPAAPGTTTLEVVNSFDKVKLLEDINSFKVDAVKYAREQIAEADFLEVKEFKDLVAIVSTVETSLKDNKDTGPTINILVQNLSEKFRDDC